jgi:leucyl/phenylalanyl-tRNA--protein transferase
VRARRGDADEQALVEGLLHAYRMGAFPMADHRTGAIEFYSADPRGILPLSAREGLHVPRSVDREIRRGRFTIRTDSAFEAVMHGCALPRADGDPSWINDTLIAWFSALHRAGHAHSLEAWLQDPDTGTHALVGGIYGVSIGAAFFGESMFCIPQRRRDDGSRHPLDGSDASKVCLVLLVRHLAACGYQLFDTQMVTDHVARFGAIEIPRDRYLRRLTLATGADDAWRPLPASD